MSAGVCLGREIIKTKGINQAASSSLAVVSVDAGISGMGAERLRVDIYTGRVASTPDLFLYHSSGNNVWVASKSISLSASTDKSCTITILTSTTEVVSTSHGFVEDQPIMLNGTTLPGGADAETIYYVKYVDANTFKISTQKGPIADGVPLVTFTSNGSSVTATALAVNTIALNPETSTDISNGYIPCRPLLQVRCTTAGGETVQIGSIKLIQPV